jgi:DNA-binding NtrC family response regulator
MTYPEKKRRIILVVDDEVEVQEMLEMTLMDLGFKVIKASNGRESLNIISKTRPDLIITDYYMPNLGGVKFLEKIQEMKVDAPIICMSGIIDNKTFRENWRSGIFGFLPKPFRVSDLVDIVKNALKMDV